jgi:hypothetical protein
MEWLKKHTDTVMILGAMLGGMIWMNGKFNKIEQDMAVVKTVLIMKGIMPNELASNKVD